MAIDFEYPPIELSPEMASWLERLQEAINAELDSVNRILVRQTVPEKAREGRIYYLTEDLVTPNAATQGYYVIFGDDWYRVDLTPVVGTPGDV